nr:telomere-binding protein [Saccharomycopsis crataegensis]
MSPKQTDRAMKMLKSSIIDDLLIELKELKIKVEDEEKLKNDLLKNKRKSKRVPPKVEESKKCVATCKNGKPCCVAMCDKKLKLCWAHMDKDQRIGYRKIKAKKNIIEV